MPRFWILLLVVGNGGVAVAERWVSSGATVALISVMPIATALWSGHSATGRGAWSGWPSPSARRRRRDADGARLQGSLTGTLMILCGTTCWSLARCSRGDSIFRTAPWVLERKCSRPE